MKKEIKTLVLLNVLALIAWGLVGGANAAYQVSAAEGFMSMTVAFWLLLVMSLITAGAMEYYAFQSLVRFLKAFYRWIEMRNFGS